MNRLSGIDGAQDIMPPKKLILNPPKNPSQQPTPRIKFTNINKDVAKPGITDEGARKRPDEHAKVAPRGQTVASTETPARTSQRGTASRDSSHVGATPAEDVEVNSQRGASIASAVAADEPGNMPRDSSMTDAPPDEEKPGLPIFDSLDLNQDVASAPSMQPPTTIPQQQPHSAQATHPPPARPPYQITTAFERIMRDPGKGRVTYRFDSPFGS